MAKLILNRFLIDLINTSQQVTTESVVDIDANNIRSLINKLNQQFPGTGEKLQSNFCVAIDGEIFSDPLLETINPDSEIYFLPAIEGG